MIGKAASERIASVGNWIKQDFGLKVALGIGLASARRAYRLAMPITDRAQLNGTTIE